MGVMVAAGIAGAFHLFGTEWLFQPASWNVSAGWIAVSIVTGATGAFAGGLLCQRLDRSGKGTKLLVAAIVIVGGAALFQAGEAPTVVRGDAVERVEVLRSAVQPLWVTVLNSVLAAMAALVGAKQAQRSRQ